MCSAAGSAGSRPMLARPDRVRLRLPRLHAGGRADLRAGAAPGPGPRPAPGLLRGGGRGGGGEPLRAGGVLGAEHGPGPLPRGAARRPGRWGRCCSWPWAWSMLLARIAGAAPADPGAPLRGRKRSFVLGLPDHRRQPYPHHHLDRRRGRPARHRAARHGPGPRRCPSRRRSAPASWPGSRPCWPWWPLARADERRDPGPLQARMGAILVAAGGWMAVRALPASGLDRTVASVRSAVAPCGPLRAPRSCADPPVRGPLATSSLRCGRCKRPRCPFPPGTSRFVFITLNKFHNHLPGPRASQGAASSPPCRQPEEPQTQAGKDSVRPWRTRRRRSRRACGKALTTGGSPHPHRNPKPTVRHRAGRRPLDPLPQVVRQHLVDAAFADHPAVLHHQHPVGHGAHHVDVVGHQHVGQAVAALEAGPAAAAPASGWSRPGSWWARPARRCAGCTIRARAMAMRWRWPPENSWG